MQRVVQEVPRSGGSRRRPLLEVDLLRMGLPRRLWKSRFDTIPNGADEGKSPRDVVGEYIRRMDEMLGRGIGLLLWGEKGRGKSSASAVIAKEAKRRGATVLYIESETLVTSIRMRLMFDEIVLVEERARNVDLLVIDDFGKEYKDESGMNEKKLESLIRSRVSGEKTTILSSNLTIESLKVTYKETLVDVMGEAVVPVKFTGTNFRDDARKELVELLK